MIVTMRDWANLYPVCLFAIFMIAFCLSKKTGKRQFLLQTLGALFIVIILAHLNRWFHIWPSHKLFPSAHMSFCLGVSVSLGMLRPWTLAITLPLLVPFGALILSQHYHSLFDLLGAIPLVLVVYGLVHWNWIRRAPSPPLDSGEDKP